MTIPSIPAAARPYIAEAALTLYRAVAALAVVLVAAESVQPGLGARTLSPQILAAFAIVAGCCTLVAAEEPRSTRTLALGRATAGAVLAAALWRMVVGAEGIPDAHRVPLAALAVVSALVLFISFRAPRRAS